MEQDSIQNEYPLYCLSDAGRSKPISVEVVVDGKPLTMHGVGYRSCCIAGIGEYISGVLA